VSVSILDRAGGTVESAVGYAEVAVDEIAAVGWVEGTLPAEIRVFEEGAEDEGPLLGYSTITFSLRYRGMGPPSFGGGVFGVGLVRTGIRREAAVSGSITSSTGWSISLDEADGFLGSDIALP